MPKQSLQCPSSGGFVAPPDAIGRRRQDQAPPVLEPLVLAAMFVQAERDAEIIAQGERAQYCFQVVTGCVRTVRLLEDGRRQVGEFLLLGDVFGWEAVGNHEFAAEAVTPVTLRRFRLSAIEHRASADRIFAQNLRCYASSQVRAARRHLVLIGRKTAAQRIASFLLEMDDRLQTSVGDMIELPMPRVDIADYLGLTIETVCRALAELRRNGTITMERPHIAILDRRVLASVLSDGLQ